MEILRKEIEQADAVIMHNAQYDLGCLLFLGIPIKGINVLDTKIMSILHDSSSLQHSLEFLSKKFLKASDQKDKGALIELIRKHELLMGSTGKPLNPEAKTYDDKAIKYAYENMDLIQEKDFDLVARYANQDTVATGQLFKFFNQYIDVDTALYWCKFQRICTEIRAKGIRVDLTKLNQAINELEPYLDKLQQDIYKLFGEEFNILSPSQLGPLLVDRGVKLPVTETGKISTKKDFLDKYAGNEYVDAVLDYRKHYKLLNDFLIKIRDMQQYSCPEALVEGAKYGRVFPCMNLFGARTGRFSSSQPNIQQIPKKDEIWGPRIRAIFVPDSDNSKWYSLDWSSQESRLQVHYAARIGCEGVDQLVTAYRDDPNLDLHQTVADLAAITRSQAKPINLGLSYGMGQVKLCRSLGLPTKMIDHHKWGRVEVAGDDGKYILDKYHKAVPFMKQLIDTCKKSIVKKGYIKTLGDRKLKIDHEREYTAISKLIQGSAADQCLEVLNLAYEANLDIKCIVHDEFNIEGTEEDAVFLKSIMETAYELEVPMVAEISVGNSWGELEDVKK